MSLEEGLEGLFKSAVGVLKISPLSFYDLTVAEINLGLEGYVQEKEEQANLNMMAMARALNSVMNGKKMELFDFMGKPKQKVEKSTMELRQETFLGLGINEGE